MKAADWIDRVKEVKNWPTDYRVAKELGFRTSTISQYRSRGGAMDEEIAVKVADAIGESREAVVLDQLVEQVKEPSLRALLQEKARQLCILC